jgi:hypothetical protein
MKMEETDCSETLTCKIQTPGNYQEESLFTKYCSKIGHNIYVSDYQPIKIKLSIIYIIILIIIIIIIIIIISMDVSCQGLVCGFNA